MSTAFCNDCKLDVEVVEDFSREDEDGLTFSCKTCNSKIVVPKPQRADDSDESRLRKQVQEMCNYITTLARMLEVSSLVIERAHTLYKFFVTRRTREKKPMLPIHHKQIA